MAGHEARSWRRLVLVGLGVVAGLATRSSRGSTVVTVPETPRPSLQTAAVGHAAHDPHDFGFEERDTRVAALVKVMVVSVIIIAGSITSLFLVVGRLTRIDDRHPPLTRQQTATIVPPGPHLQDDPFRDIAHERKREQMLLTTYGYLDPAHTQARIPIDRAIALVIGKSLDPSP